MAADQPDVPKQVDASNQPDRPLSPVFISLEEHNAELKQLRDHYSGLVTYEEDCLRNQIAFLKEECGQSKHEEEIRRLKAKHHDAIDRIKFERDHLIEVNRKYREVLAALRAENRRLTDLLRDKTLKKQ